MKSTLNAFTLLEMIISIILGSIVVVLIYGIVSMMRVSWERFALQQQQISDAISFRVAFGNDIDRSTIIFQKAPFSFEMTGAKDTIAYVLNGCVIRTQGKESDTFLIKTTSVYASYLNINTPDKVVKNIKFYLADPYLSQNVSFDKHYSTQDMIGLISNCGVYGD